MDLVFTDTNLNDIAVLDKWSIDLAFGSDENDFELQVSLNNTSIGQIDVGSYVYIIGTGYGGIIDSKEIKTADSIVYFRGRSFEGILEGNVVMPPSGASYYVANGDCNTIIANLIDYCGLSGTFTANSKKCGTEVSNYLLRYNNLYESLYQMLLTVDKKLQFEPVSDDDGKTKFQISAIDIIDFSKEEEWNSDTINVDITQYQNQVNHLICLGSGNLAARNVIHLFCDSNGNVQDYTTSDTPIKDADYILDESKKALSGVREVTEVYDYSNVENIDNYVLLEEEPSDWSNQTQFFTKDGDSYEALDFNYLTKYKCQTSQPSDWENYSNYYVMNSDGSYSSVPGTIEYVQQTSEPDDWETNYSSYYYRYKSGTSLYDYRTVEGDDYYYYVLTVEEPISWSTNYKNYYTYGNNQHYAVGAVTYTAERGDTMIYESISTALTYKLYNSCKIGNTNVCSNSYVLDPETIRTFYESWGSQATTFVFNHNINVPTLLTNIDAAQSKADDYVEDKKTSDYKALSSLVTTINNQLASSGLSCAFEISSKNKYMKIWLTAGGLNAESTFYIGYTYSYQAAPAWTPNTYYERKTGKTAPEWDKEARYTKTTVPPTWQIGTYYTNYVSKELHDFETNTYYRLYTDHFSNLVTAGLARLADLRSTDTIEATIESNNTYDVGDLIAINDETTGINISQRIIKKIVNASNETIKVKYTLGG